jgi:hypothetical protein
MISAVGALALVGCGVASTAVLHPQRIAVAAATREAPAVSWDALCDHIAGVSMLRVTRSVFPQNDVSFTIPSRLMAVDRTHAQAVATTVCSLNTVPAGAIYYCTADFGVAYQLQFTLARRRERGGGCQARRLRVGRVAAGSRPHRVVDQRGCSGSSRSVVSLDHPSALEHAGICCGSGSRYIGHVRGDGSELTAGLTWR